MLRWIVALCFLVTPAAAADQGYFACLHLAPEQLSWFAQAGISACCNIADGMPTRYEQREDGVYVPSLAEAIVEARACRSEIEPAKPSADRSTWVRVPDKAIQPLLNKSNPIGVAIVWWSNASWPDAPSFEHKILCFIKDLDV